MLFYVMVDYVMCSGILSYVMYHVMLCYVVLCYVWYITFPHIVTLAISKKILQERGQNKSCEYKGKLCNDPCKGFQNEANLHNFGEITTRSRRRYGKRRRMSMSRSTGNNQDPQI